LASESKVGTGLIWQGTEYPRIPPGDYLAVCSGWQGPEWVRAFYRWSLRLEFSLLSGEGTVSGFLNLGNDPAKRHIARRSKFYALWCQANGEMPRKGQPMTLDTFTDPTLTYLVRVGDALKDAKDELKPDALVYSRVTEILKVERRRDSASMV